MLTKKFGYYLVTIGVSTIVLSLSIDIIDLGHKGIQAAQLLVAEVGVAIVLFGYIFIVRLDGKPNLGKDLHTWVVQFLSSPIVAVLVGLFTAYFIFFIIPMFLNTDMRVQYFNRYLPDRYPVGWDLETLLNHIRTWFVLHTPYPGEISQFYPPLTYVIFSPLVLVDYPTAYKLVTFTTLVSYLFLTLLLPIWVTSERNHSLAFLMFATGIFSYGLQFELERGQYNVIAMTLCLLAVYLYHFNYKLRYVAYFLFSISVQLKVFPLIFIFMLIKDWRDWKNNIKRFVGIGLFNIFFLFVLGYRVFIDFVNAITEQVVTPSWNWNGNHSIQAFVFNLMKDGYGLIQPDALANLSDHSLLVTMSLMIIFALCLFLLLASACHHNEGGLNPYLLLVCTIGALIIPTSNDYTLSFFTGPVVILLCSIAIENAFKLKYFSSFLIAIVSFSYSSTLFPFKYKPYFLNNNFPALFIILVSITILYFLRNRYKKSAFKGG